MIRGRMRERVLGILAEPDVRLMGQMKNGSGMGAVVRCAPLLEMCGVHGTLMDVASESYNKFITYSSSDMFEPHGLVPSVPSVRDIFISVPG
ncbi:hypothetical protein GCM10025859_05300 [Alicyclobacillus fastidiosus]|nr:hypothetical protein GCM10025859_05300 [Alicyclobacillus fastidiosus]